MIKHKDISEKIQNYVSQNIPLEEILYTLECVRDLLEIYIESTKKDIERQNTNE